MKPVVVDASVLVACLFKEGRARQVLLHAKGVGFVVPPDIVREAGRQLPRVALRAGITAAQSRSVLRVLLGRVQEVPIDALRTQEKAARALAGSVGDETDWEYVALALALDAPIWTYDDDFRRMKGIRLIGTAEVEGFR